MTYPVSQISRIITDYSLSGNKTFPLIKCIRRLCKMGRSFIPVFDVNGFILLKYNSIQFDEDMREKRF